MQRPAPLPTPRRLPIQAQLISAEGLTGGRQRRRHLLSESLVCSFGFVVYGFVRLGRSSPRSLLGFHVGDLIVGRVVGDSTTCVMVMIPVIMRFLSVLLFDLVLQLLYVIRIRGVSLSSRRYLSEDLMTLLNGRVDFLDSLRLNDLIVGIFRRRRGVLVRASFLLTGLKRYRVTIELNGLRFTPTLAPIRGQSHRTSFRRLISLWPIVNDVGHVIFSNVASHNGGISATTISFNDHSLMVNFRLAAAGVLNRQVIFLYFLWRGLVGRP